MAAISNINFGLKLCEILKLDPKKTKDIIITCMVEEPVMVYTTQYFQDTEVDAVVELLKSVSPTFVERERIIQNKKNATNNKTT